MNPITDRSGPGETGFVESRERGDMTFDRESSDHLIDKLCHYLKNVM
jgi:hypothetical protein